MKSIFLALLFALCLTGAAQAPAYDDLTMESDETTETYAARGKNYVFIRSKRGSGGVESASKADSIKTFNIREIVLVFSEVTEAAFEEREDANRERWENLMRTYPEYFQSGTTYRSICQCQIGGDNEAFKKTQGFYVYFKPKAPPVAEVTASTIKTEERKPTEKVEAAKETAKTEPVAAKEKTQEAVAAVEESPKAESADYEAEEEVKPVKKSTAIKPRRAKDSKACRPACYEGGEEDLNAFFKNNIVLSKKERRKVKNLSSVAKLQINHDGSIIKSAVTGEDEWLNKKVIGAVNAMNRWNPSVKSGVTVKSEVKLTLKYDKASKALKPFEVAIIPRPAPKCKCVSDAEMFGSGD
jgi:flagellar biosynthesis GTPase FlhF